MESVQFDTAVLPLRDKMFRFARSILLRPDEAEDVTQDTLLKLLQSPTGLAGCRNVEAFAMTVLRNGCYDRLRRRQVRGYDSDFPTLAVPDDSGRMSDRELVAQAMARLPDAQREVLHLKDIEGYQTYEVAEMMDMEENRLRVILSRARKRMREEVIKIMEYGTNR